MFCLREKIDPYKASKNDILNFLIKKFEAGASYGTLNSTRSAISLISINDFTKDSDLSRFFRGVFRLRPTKPKYDKTWDPGVLLRSLASYCALEDSNLQKMSEKLATLLALGTAHRMQTLSLIQIDNIRPTREGFEIEIPDLIKTSRPGRYQPLLVIPYIKEKPEICIASFLKRSGFNGTVKK